MASWAATATIHIQTLDDAAQPLSGIDYQYIFAADPPDTVSGYTDGNGQATIIYDTPTAVPEGSTSFFMAQPYPNPAVGSAVLSFALTRNASDFQVKLYDVDGRLVGQAPAVAGEIRWPQRLAYGVYLATVTDREGVLASRKLVGSFDRLEFSIFAASREQREVITTATVLISQEPGDGWEQLTAEDVEIVDGEQSHDWQLAADQQAHVIAGITTNLGDEFISGTWNFRMLSDGQVYSASFSPGATWTTEIPGSYSLEDSVDIYFSGNPEVSTNTYSFIDRAGPSATHTLFTSDGSNAPDTARVALGDLVDRDLAGIVMDDADIANVTLRELIGIPDGIEKWINPERIYYSQLDVYPSGDPITSERQAEQQAVAEFFMDLDSMPNVGVTFATTYFEEGFGFPDPWQGRVSIYQDDSIGPGNWRAIVDGTYEFAYAHTRGWDPISTMILEVAEAIGINDDSSGSNGLGFVIEDGVVIDINELGLKAFRAANLFLPGDLKPIDGSPVQTQTLDIDVWNITGDTPLAGGTVRGISSQGIFSGVTDGSGHVAFDFDYTAMDDEVAIVFDGYPGYTNGTGALIDPDLAVATGGRIDAAASFASPDTIHVDPEDPRLDEMVRLQLLPDEYFEDGIFRDMMGIIMNRDDPYMTDILSNWMNQNTWELGGPLPQDYLDDWVAVVEGISAESSQVNGAQLIQMTYQVIPEPIYEFEDRHLLYGDHVNGTPGNFVWDDENGHLTYAEGFTPQTTSIIQMAEEAYNSFLDDPFCCNLQDIAIELDDSGRLNDFGRNGLALHYMLENGTDCDP